MNAGRFLGFGAARVELLDRRHPLPRQFARNHPPGVESDERREHREREPANMPLSGVRRTGSAKESTGKEAHRRSDHAVRERDQLSPPRVEQAAALLARQRRARRTEGRHRRHPELHEDAIAVRP